MRVFWPAPHQARKASLFSLGEKLAVLILGGILLFMIVFGIVAGSKTDVRMREFMHQCVVIEKQPEDRCAGLWRWR